MTLSNISKIKMLVYHRGRILIFRVNFFNVYFPCSITFKVAIKGGHKHITNGKSLKSLFLLDLVTDILNEIIESSICLTPMMSGFTSDTYGKSL